MLLVADSLFQYQSDAMGLELCIKAQRVAKESGLADKELDEFITMAQASVEQKAERLLSVSEQIRSGHDHRGVSDGTVSCVSETDSMLHDSYIIKEIVSDTLAAYDLLEEIIQDPKALTKNLICQIHARLMKSSRILPNSSSYISPGVTRTITRKTVVISGTYSVECCPYPKVDDELEYICKMAKQYIANWRNPFSTASWVHLILARCHPFEDGNGRVARMLASVPLLRCGFPPIYLVVSQKQEYYDGIRMKSMKAGEGNHKSFIECIVKSMETSIASVKNIL
ncbi:hypothetical protein DXG01_005415 [Tephrocybe rancida]|nr:hypothetical protein DXG01_005415 [Tephrocybe rancida]